MADGNRISVCMIVKNEEELLPQALASVADFADELVIVDTGSTDRTVDIAEGAGAKVYHHPWEHDFAKHRNQSIDYATSDWIFILDADEEMAEGAGDLLRKTIADPECKVVTIPVVSAAGGEAQQSSHTSIRMFRKETGLKYEGAVHNEILFDGQATFVPARLIHHGYNLSREKMLAKFKRTTDLLMREMDADPRNPKWPHYLAVSLHSENMPADALTAARASIRLCQDNADEKLRWIVNYYIAGAAALELGRLEEAEVSCREGIALYDDYLDAWAVLTSVYFIRGNRGRLQEAAERYLALHDAYRQNPKHFGTIPLHTLHLRHQILLRLALSARRAGDKTEFDLRYGEALRNSRKPGEIVAAAAQVIMKDGDRDDALALLQAGLELAGADPEVYERLIRIHLENKSLKQANEAVDQARAAGAPEARIQCWKGLIHLRVGDFQAARESLAKAAAMDQTNVDARLDLGFVAEKLGDDDTAERAYLEAINIAPTRLETAINLAALYARTNRQDNAAAFLERVVGADPSLVEVHVKLILLYWELGDADRLLGRGRFLCQLLDIPGGTTVETAPELARLFVQCANRLEEKKHGRAALWIHQAAALLEPKNVDMLLGLGERRLTHNESAGAVDVFEEAIRLAPEDWRTFDGLSRSYAAQGAEEAARMSAEQAEKLKSGDGNS